MENLNIQEEHDDEPISNKVVKVTFRLSREEEKEMNELIRQCNIGKSAYLRSRALNFVPKQMPIIDDETKRNLYAIGNNLNQVARQANSGSYDEHAFRFIIQSLKKLLYND